MDKPLKYEHFLKCLNCEYEEYESSNEYSLDMAYALCPNCHCRHWFVNYTSVNTTYVDWLEEELQDSYKVTKKVHIGFMQELSNIFLEKDLHEMKIKIGVILARGPKSGIL